MNKFEDDSLSEEALNALVAGTIVQSVYRRVYWVKQADGTWIGHGKPSIPSTSKTIALIRARLMTSFELRELEKKK